MGGAAIRRGPGTSRFKTHTHIMAGLEDISAADISESNWNEACATFDEMNLKEDLLRGIYAYGFEKPSTIQQRGIVPIVRGHDTIAQAQSGTGKTATYHWCPPACGPQCQAVPGTHPRAHSRA